MRITWSSKLNVSHYIKLLKTYVPIACYRKKKTLHVKYRNLPVWVCGSISEWPQGRQSFLSSPARRSIPGPSRLTWAWPVQQGSKWVQLQDGWSSCPVLPLRPGRSRTASTGGATDKKEMRYNPTKGKTESFIIIIIIIGITLYCWRVTCPFWKLSISSVFSALTWLSLVTSLICSDRSLWERK